MKKKLENELFTWYNFYMDKNLNYSEEDFRKKLLSLRNLINDMHINCLISYKQYIDCSGVIVKYYEKLH